MERITLVPIDRDSTARGYAGPLPEPAADALQATAALYAEVGFAAPWISYLAFVGSAPVSTCSFKSAPVDGRVEIAYFTFPGHEGRGVATAMARALVEIARRSRPDVVVAAQTLPARDASHRILEKLGFRPLGPVQHPQDGEVLEWRL